ncbi:hypothetical protein Bbelb_038200 [Branchiostoma belcheri]|nr:hypothetical protein Bbelb_038200 [Branchiostoma belcheri]
MSETGPDGHLAAIQELEGYSKGRLMTGRKIATDGVSLWNVPTLSWKGSEENLMYWVNPPTIDRAAMDGSNQTTIIRNLTDPWVITIDYTENRLYYDDYDTIYSSDMFGNNIQLVKPGDGEAVGGIAAGDDYIYWTHYWTVSL